MIRRIGILFLLALAMTACTGSERDAVTVGDTSISRTDLVDLFMVVNSGAEEELPPAVPADALRQIASTWAQDAAVETALGEEGLGMTEAERTQLDGQIDEAIATGNIGSMDSASAVYEALRRNLWVGTRVAGLSDAQRARAEELVGDVDVESRLGRFDSDAGLIVAH